MKIQRFTLINIIAVSLLIAITSAGFYAIERITMLRYLGSTLNQSVYNLEEELIKALQENRTDRVQALLDRSAAIDDAIDALSLTVDGRIITLSSSRSLRGKAVRDDYREIADIARGLSEEAHLNYSVELTYFAKSRRESALLLIDLNEAFIFGRLRESALVYGGTLFLIFAVLGIGVFAIVRRWIVRPLETIAARAARQESSGGEHLIEELTVLDQVLASSFRSMKMQQDHLREALEETRHLDRILRTVADVNQYLLSAKGSEELLRQACGRLAQHPGYDLCHVALKSGDALVIEAFSADPTDYLYRGMKIALNPDGADGLEPAVRAYKEKVTVIFEQLEKNASLGGWRYIAEKGRFGSLIAIPLLESMENPPIGVLTIYTKNSYGFDSQEVAMLEELAGDIGFAIASYRHREELQYHQTTDAITDLPNRVSLMDALDKEGTSALAIVNIDRFSDVNEVYGVEIGDAILSGYGHWLRRKLASQEGITLYKLGSDEYAFVFERCGDLHYCTTFLEGLIEQTQKESFVIEGIEIVLTITAGIAPVSEHTLEHAAAALKQAKRKRHSLEVFSVAFKAEQENNIAWYKRIKEAVEESRIVPYFQPIVDNATGKIIKYEALIRMIAEDGKVISPFHFLEVAKKTKIYPELTKMMIAKVIERFRGGNVPVSLNLSTQDLTNPDLADYLEAVIHEEGVGKLILFEILESEGFENYEAVSLFIDRFRSIGCRFAIDDFGSGFSNFDHLLRLNVDTLKIDGSLIKNLPHDRNAQIIVRHIADFAREMGIMTVAEFVANEAIYRRVCEIGIDASQGYYFYEPSDTPVGE